MNDNQSVNIELEKDRSQARGQYQLDLTDLERVAVTGELRRYGQMREDMAFGHSDGLGEHWAELCADPRYSGSSSDLNDAYQQESRRAYRMQDGELGQASLWFEVAEAVERTGRLELADPDTRFALTEVIEDAGWRDPVLDSRPPDDLRRVVEAMSAPAESRPVDQRFDGSSWTTRQMGAQIEQSSMAVRRPDQRMPPRSAPESRARTP